MTSPARVPWPLRAVLLWALLAGLFLMHGAASPAGGCMSGVPMTAMSLSTTASPTTALPSMASPSVPAGPATAALVRSDPSGSQVATTGHGDRSGDGMLCVTRQPGAAVAGPGAAPPVPLAVPGAEPGPVALDVAAARVDRPPGAPGLPLPLFLCVSRT